jgi:hypothetical protein
MLWEFRHRPYRLGIYDINIDAHIMSWSNTYFFTPLLHHCTQYWKNKTLQCLVLDWFQPGASFFLIFLIFRLPIIPIQTMAHSWHYWFPRTVIHQCFYSRNSLPSFSNPTHDFDPGFAAPRFIFKVWFSENQPINILWHGSLVHLGRACYDNVIDNVSGLFHFDQSELLHDAWFKTAKPNVSPTLAHLALSLVLPEPVTNAVHNDTWPSDSEWYSIFLGQLTELQWKLVLTDMRDCKTAIVPLLTTDCNFVIAN